MWYYTTTQQFEELLDTLDSTEMEAPLVRELLEMKDEIIRQMNVTEKLYEQNKGNKKSYLEVENANILKRKKLFEQKLMDSHGGVGNVDKQLSLASDEEVVNEVTVTTDEMLREENDIDMNDDDDSETKKLKNNTIKKSNILKKNDEGMYTELIFKNFTYSQKN